MMRIKPAILYLLILLSLAGVALEFAGSSGNSEAKGPLLNDFQCYVPGAGEACLHAETDGKEEELRDFFTALNAQFGKPEITFLSFTIRDFDEFFDPSRRKIDPAILASPYGMQKIMTWDSLVFEGSRDTFRLSLQVEQKRRGKRPIDPLYVDLELRVLNQHDENVIQTGDERWEDWFDHYLLKHVGSPKPLTRPAGYRKSLNEYEAMKMDYNKRLQGLPVSGCFPAITGRTEWKVFRLNLCEDEGMQDTLHLIPEVKDVFGNNLQHYIYDGLNDEIVQNLRIYSASLDYWIWVPRLGEMHSFILNDRGGKEYVFYREGEPVDIYLPFKARYGKEFFMKKLGLRHKVKSWTNL